jgi:hypothetical protein
VEAAVTGRRRRCRCRTCSAPPLHGIGRVIGACVGVFAFVMLFTGTLMLAGMPR